MALVDTGEEGEGRMNREISTDIDIYTHCVLSCVLLFVTPWTIYSPPASSVHGDSPGQNTGIGCHFFLQGIFPTQGSNPYLLP